MPGHNWIPFGGILVISGGTQHAQRFVVPPMLVRNPRRDDLAIVLNFGYPILLPGPFAIGLDEVGPQFLQAIEILLCGVSIAASGYAKGAGEHQSRFSVRKFVPRKCPLLGQAKRRRLVPTPTFDRVPRGQRGRCKSIEKVRNDFDGGDLIDYASGSYGLPSLQIAVDKEIHRVRLEEEIVDGCTGLIRGDRFVPKAHAIEDVSGKLQRMRRRGRYLG